MTELSEAQKTAQKKYLEKNQENRRQTLIKYNLSHGRTNTFWYPGKKNTCQICGKTFEPHKFQPTQQYCDSTECTRIRNLKKYTKYNAKRK